MRQPMMLQVRHQRANFKLVKIHKLDLILATIYTYSFSGPIAFAQPKQQTWQQARDKFLEEKTIPIFF